MKKIFYLLISVFIFQTISVNQSEAIPVFARKYRTSCSTCHIVVFKRNAFGEAFRKNGFRIPGDDEFFIKETPVKLGAEAWKRKFPDAIWPGLLPQTVPISFYSHLRAIMLEDAGSKPDFTFKAHELEMLIGGTFGQRISFFGTWLVFEEGHSAEDIGRLGELFVQFNDILDVFDSFGENIFNIKFGRMEIGAIQSFKEDNRITLAHYKTNDYKVDKFNLRKQQSGIEANGILFDRLDYSVGVVNGNLVSVKDNNDHKDVFWRVAYKLFGMSLTGMGPEGEALNTSENWRDDSIQVAVFGYHGDSNFENPGTTTTTITLPGPPPVPVTVVVPKSDSIGRHEFRRMGVDLRALYSRFELGFAFVKGTDNMMPLMSPIVGPGFADIDSYVYFIEGQAMIFPWLYAVVRYEDETWEQDSPTMKDVTIKDVENLVLNLTVLQRANVRWSFEGLIYLNDDLHKKSNTGKINLLFAF